MATERWLPVVGYEGFYEVSDKGRVRGVDRVIKRCECGRPTVFKRGRLLGLIMRPDGYPRVSLSKNNRYVQATAHSLVLEAFVSPRPTGMHGCHNNGKRDDARLENLRWDTVKNNHVDRWAHGTMLVGEQTNSVKLTARAVREIRASTDTHPTLATRYAVHPVTIGRIKRRETWRHV